jgi:hypothetical protein
MCNLNPSIDNLLFFFPKKYPSKIYNPTIDKYKNAFKKGN